MPVKKKNWEMIIGKGDFASHYNDVIMGAIASQITSLTIVFSTVYADADKKIKAPRHWPFAGNSPGTGEFPAQMASNAGNDFISWRHHVHVWRIPEGNTLSQLSQLLRTHSIILSAGTNGINELDMNQCFSFTLIHCYCSSIIGYESYVIL